MSERDFLLNVNALTPEEEARRDQRREDEKAALAEAGAQHALALDHGKTEPLRATEQGVQRASNHGAMPSGNGAVTFVNSYGEQTTAAKAERVNVGGTELTISMAEKLGYLTAGREITAKGRSVAGLPAEPTSPHSQPAFAKPAAAVVPQQSQPSGASALERLDPHGVAAVARGLLTGSQTMDMDAVATALGAANADEASRTVQAVQAELATRAHAAALEAGFTEDELPFVADFAMRNTGESRNALMRLIGREDAGAAMADVFRSARSELTHADALARSIEANPAHLGVYETARGDVTIFRHTDGRVYVHSQVTGSMSLRDAVLRGIVSRGAR